MSFDVFNVMRWRESEEKVGNFSQLNKASYCPSISQPGSTLVRYIGIIPLETAQSNFVLNTIS
jgi:hypothetical protein